jgi:hypothetical protein
MTKLSDGEIIGLFKQHLKVLREGRDSLAAHITANRDHAIACASCADR